MLRVNKIQFIFAILLCFCVAAFAETTPTEEDVNKLSQQSKQTYDDFLNQTFEIRMRYEYFGRFNDPCDKELTRKLALTAVNDLDAIANNQLNLKKTIETYQKDDWETRYGQTGLWRRAASDLFKTTMTRLEVQYYLALAFDQPGQTDILHQIITQLDTLGNPANSPYWHLLKAKTLALLSTTDPAYKSLAKNELDFIFAQKDVPCFALFKAEMEMIKLTGKSKALADQIAQTECKYDNEITLMLACLEHRFEPESLEKTLTLFSLAKDMFGRIVIDDLHARYKKDIFADVNSLPITAYEVEQAASVVSGVGLENYASLFERLVSSPKYRTPSLLFITGRALIDSSPAKTTRLWIDASRLMKAKSNGMSPEKIARLALGSSGKLHSNDCPLILEAYDNYLLIANPDSDTDFNIIEYTYASVLDSCGENKRSNQLLEKIASTSGQYQNHAKFELISQKLQQNQSAMLMEQLAGLIHAIPEKLSLRDDAITLYCQTLLADANAQSAQKVLDILASNDSKPKFNLFKAQAFGQLGRLEESARFLSQALDANDVSIALQAVSLLTEILDRIESWQQDANDFNAMLRNCVILAESVKNEQSDVIVAEISIFDGKKIAIANENDPVWLRPKARLLMTQNDFNEAAQLWAKIAELKRNDPAARYNWWQAKFYELDCLAKSPQADKQNILHTIEVLQSSYTDIPLPWAEKLDSLKQQCGFNPPAN